MIRTAVTLDLTKHDADTAARRRRVFAALGSVDSRTLVRIVVDRDAYFDDTVSRIASLTLSCDVEVSGPDARYVRQYACLLATFQEQCRRVEAGDSR
ncbi:hypothetical protein GCM10009839_38970 [Catenulispora yoronensis]|uniref:Uncharacterized protein n=1 Tax=Catenulispora yoronensis TaxID=450799 RepID=A0ABP5FV55_9ACTN